MLKETEFMKDRLSGVVLFQNTGIPGSYDLAHAAGLEPNSLNNVAYVS